MQPDMWRESWLAKFDQRGGGWAYGLVTVKAPHLPAFYGAHGQLTVSDAVMVYGEVGSSARAFALQSPTDAAQPFTVQVPASRKTSTLAGAAYTFEDGTSLTGEYLHEGSGYTAAEESAYFQRAVTLPGMALGLAPRLFGRDYLHVVWQANMMSETGYWRLMFTRNLTDGSNEFAGYGETTVHPRISLFALAVVPQGNSRQEFSALFTRSITAGLKIALP
jgi:hypothetical protein